MLKISCKDQTTDEEVLMCADGKYLAQVEACGLGVKVSCRDHRGKGDGKGYL